MSGTGAGQVPYWLSKQPKWAPTNIMGLHDQNGYQGSLVIPEKMEKWFQDNIIQYIYVYDIYTYHISVILTLRDC